MFSDTTSDQSSSAAQKPTEFLDFPPDPPTTGMPGSEERNPSKFLSQSWCGDLLLHVALGFQCANTSPDIPSLNLLSFFGHRPRHNLLLYLLPPLQQLLKEKHTVVHLDNVLLSHCVHNQPR